MRLAKDWVDYEILEAGNGIKIERYDSLIVKRPDPVASWPLINQNIKIDAWYDTSWHLNKVLKDDLLIQYKDLKFKIKPTTYKHTGIFPEQAVNWDWVRTVIKTRNEPLRILNLFGYTGAATVACAREENVIEVVHVDALKSLNNWTKENVILNSLESKTIRTITEDVLKFLDREIRRGRTYHGIIMDPPSYGKGSKGEVWRIEEKLPILIDKVMQVLDKDALFIVLNTYTSNLPQSKVQSLLDTSLISYNFKPTTDSQEIGLPITNSNNILKAGVTTRWSYNENLL